MNYKELINKKCTIIPLEHLKGTIIGVYIAKKGVEYQVRYFLNGKPEIEYFFEWEID